MQQFREPGSKAAPSKWSLRSFWISTYFLMITLLVLMAVFCDYPADGEANLHDSVTQYYGWYLGVVSAVGQPIRCILKYKIDFLFTPAESLLDEPRAC